MKNLFSEGKGCIDIKMPMENFLARIVCVEPEGKLILEDEKLIKRGYMFKEVEYLLK